METACESCQKAGQEASSGSAHGHNAINNSMNNDNKTGSRMNRQVLPCFFSTFDQKECMAAFAEGRKANITGS
jgi:hypothetical protein